MATPQVIAPPCAQPGSPGTPGARPDVTPTSGVIHVNVRHISGFTVIGNHLAQHRGLSLTAIGLAAHIQSLPNGAKIGIKALSARFPEGEVRIAAALRELEATGYLHRSREPLPDGRIVTRTYSYNQPGAKIPPIPTPQPRRSKPRATPVTAPPVTPAPPRDARTAPTAPATPPEPTQPPAPVFVPAPTAPRKQPPPLPQPHAPSQELHQAAATLLADLRRHTPQLGLPEGEIKALAPGVAAWLERDAHPDTIRHALTYDLPTPVKHPARLLRHRITTLLPPPLPGMKDLTPSRRKVIVIPLQNCDTCDRAFRAHEPGHCRGCRTTTHADLHATA
ncbi:helix-turn-helix domain-containing protein [Streptomyces sp. NBC_01104]|uniref:helix-turn-helix domain-containing protein n=1 Tax=Streptomyces sp. NBC_01104 TaxID=2903750 RepID=UPI003869945D|nr:helix-turn-helix domain-containing protein [Streptomyces sp. NBC_01104]